MILDPYSFSWQTRQTNRAKDLKQKNEEQSEELRMRTTEEVVLIISYLGGAEKDQFVCCSCREGRFLMQLTSWLLVPRQQAF